VQQVLIEEKPQLEVEIFIVWIDILEGDGPQAVHQAAGAFSKDPRVRHYHDPRRELGRSVAKGLGAVEGETAWDVYLFYAAGQAWGEQLPRPMVWVHQLETSGWAGADHFFQGPDLVDRLRIIASRLPEGA
jgi:hypothetical protein